MTKNLLLASVATLLLWGAPVHAATSGQTALGQTTRPIYAWNSDTEHDNARQKQNYCLIKNMYDNGTAMTIAENNDGIQRLALTFPKGNLKQGQHVDLALQIDNRDVFPVEAVVASPRILTIAVPEGLFDQMRKGQSMHLRGPQDEVAYGLNGIDGAINALRDCLTIRKQSPDAMQTAMTTPPSPETDTLPATAIPTAKGEAVTTMNVAPTAAPLPPVANDRPVPTTNTVVKTEDKLTTERPTAAVMSPAPEITPKPPASVEKPVVEAPVAYTPPEAETQPTENTLPFAIGKIVADAGFTPTRLMPRDIAQHSRSADYAWKNGEVVLAVKQMTISGDNVFGEDNTAYLARLKAACDGQFVAEASPAILASGGKPSYQLAETACSSKMGDQITAVLFTALPEGTAAFTTQGKADDGASAIKTRDALLNAALR